MNLNKTILSLCDFSGAWSQPYVDAGYNVIRVDLKHGQDVRLLKVSGLPKIHGILAAPPCTYFAIAGTRNWKKWGEGKLIEGLSIVDACLRIVAMTSPAWWVLENPCGRLSRFIGKPRLIFQPYEYGDPYMKRTCLWGQFNGDLPLNRVEPMYRMMATKRSDPLYDAIPEMPGTRNDGATIRSTTPPGFAKAFFEANP
jgi:hypothetical protein